MLSEERHKLILEKLERESVVYLNDLVKYLNTSESTIRRDLTALALKAVATPSAIPIIKSGFASNSGKAIVCQ